MRIVQEIVARGLLSEENPSVVCYDMDLLRARFKELQRSFPSTALHAVAIKANPLVSVLKQIVQMGGGLEAASLEEVYLALAAGCPPERIVYDSPAKTHRDLEIALDLGIYINADNFEEIHRIADLQKKKGTSNPVGVRINPALGTGKIPLTGVSSPTSKFGIRIDSNQADDQASLMDAFGAFPWLVGLHVHIGSQGYDLPSLVEGVSCVFQCVEKIRERFGKERVQRFDLGGGLSVTYNRTKETAPTFTEYADALSRRIPALFESGLYLITEFGRALYANAGWAISRVEYTKKSGNSNIAVIHLGADFLLRRAYQPEHWFHEIIVYDSKGVPKSGMDRSRWTVAGPLCFAGDIIGRDLELPPIEIGDLIVIRDTGAYTLSMWSRHCSRSIPMVLGYDLDGEEYKTYVLKKRETLDDVVSFWS